MNPRDRYAVAVTARVRREIPGGVLEQRPVHELLARRVSVPVDVEQVTHCELSRADLKAMGRNRSGDLIRRGIQRVALAT